jgi:hypothetical protein
VKVLASLAAVIAIFIALAKPEVAGQAARVYLIGCAGILGFLGTRALLQPPPATTDSKFNPSVVVREVPPLPEEFRRIKAMLSHYNQAKPTVQIDPVTRNLFRAIAVQRLYYHHQLRLDLDQDAPAVQAVVSGPMWQAIGPPLRDATGTILPAHPIPASALAALIDEVERL